MYTRVSISHAQPRDGLIPDLLAIHDACCNDWSVSKTSVADAIPENTPRFDPSDAHWPTLRGWASPRMVIRSAVLSSYSTRRRACKHRGKWIVARGAWRTRDTLTRVFNYIVDVQEGTQFMTEFMQPHHAHLIYLITPVAHYPTVAPELWVRSTGKTRSLAI